MLTTLSKTAQNELANLITLLLGITISFSMKADQFVKPETLLIMVLGLVAFVLDSVVGVLFVKVLNLFTPKNKINPMVGAAGISAFPMSSRVIEKLGQEADPQNHLLMHAVAANVIRTDRLGGGWRRDPAVLCHPYDRLSVRRRRI